MKRALTLSVVLATCSLYIFACEQTDRADAKSIEVVRGVVVGPGDPIRVIGQTVRFRAKAFIQTPPGVDRRTQQIESYSRQEVRGLDGDENDVKWYSSNPAVATIDELTGLATAVSPGTAFISLTYKTIVYRDLATLRVTATQTGENDRIYVSDSAKGAISVFRADADGDVAPKWTIAGPATTLMGPDQMVIYNDLLIVADRTAGAVLFFDKDATGDTAPKYAIRGLTEPQGVAFTGGRLYISGDPSGKVFHQSLSAAGPDATPPTSDTYPSATGHLASTADANELLVVEPLRSEVETNYGAHPGRFSTVPGFDSKPNRYYDSNGPLGLASDGRFHYVTAASTFHADPADPFGYEYQISHSFGRLVVLPANIPAPEQTYLDGTRLTPFPGAMRAPFLEVPLAGIQGFTLKSPRGVSVSSEHVHIACPGDSSVMILKLTEIMSLCPDGSLQDEEDHCGNSFSPRRIAGPLTGLDKPSGVLFVADTSVPRMVSSFTLTPLDSTKTVGEDQTFVATLNYDDGTKINVTGEANWTSSNPTVAAAPNNRGVTHALAPGVTTIRAALLGGQTVETTFTVTPAATTPTDGGAPDVATPEDGGATDAATPPVDTNARLFVSSENGAAPGSIKIFALDAKDPATPLRTIQGPKTLLKNPSQMATRQGELFVVDIAAPPSVHVFKLADDGDVVPTRSISGPTNTKLGQPQGIAIVGDELYVGDKTGILVFPVGATGDVAPSRTITSVGDTTLSFVGQLGTTRTPGEVMFAASDRLLSFSTTAGTPPPALRTLSPVGLRSPYAAAVGGAAHGPIFVAYRDSIGSGIMALTDDATGTPLRNIQGASTELDRPNGLAVFNGEIFAVSTSNGRVLVFDAADTGNVAPKRKLTLPGPTADEPPNPRGVLVVPLAP